MPRDDGAESGPPGPIPGAPTEAMPEGFLAPGQVLGDRYQIRSQLGRGGKARQEAVEGRPEFAPAATGPIERRSDNETKSK